MDWTLRNTLGFTAHSPFIALHCAWESGTFYLQCLCLRSSICMYSCLTALSRSCQHCPRPALQTKSVFPCTTCPFTNNFSKFMGKSTHHAPSSQLAIKLVGTDKGNMQLMIESIQAPGFIFSPKIRRGCVKNKIHKPLVKYTLLLPIYSFMSNCLRR